MVISSQRRPYFCCCYCDGCNFLMIRSLYDEGLRSLERLIELELVCLERSQEAVENGSITFFEWLEPQFRILL
jgi:hypothetical protein